MARKAVVLLSGGLDSTTTLAVAKHQGFELYALSFDYGQRHTAELDASRRVASEFAVVQHLVLPLDERLFGGSALTSGIDVPKNRPESRMNEGVPVTYVPARNAVFLSLGLAWAESLGSSDIFIGVNAIDFSGYPDCRPDFIASFEKMANLATKAGIEEGGIRIHAPLIRLKKSEIIKLGLDLGVDYALTRTCYDPLADDTACGRCDACQLRQGGFTEAGLTDPVAYA